MSACPIVTVPLLERDAQHVGFTCFSDRSVAVRSDRVKRHQRLVYDKRTSCNVRQRRGYLMLYTQG